MAALNTESTKKITIQCAWADGEGQHDNEPSCSSLNEIYCRHLIISYIIGAERIGHRRNVNGFIAGCMMIGMINAHSLLPAYNCSDKEEELFDGVSLSRPISSQLVQSLDEWAVCVLCQKLFPFLRIIYETGYVFSHHPISLLCIMPRRVDMSPKTSVVRRLLLQ